MSKTEPAITFHEMLAYTDFLAHRWLYYFKQNQAALEVNVGGKTPTLHDLVTHIFQVELFFAGLLTQGASAPPPNAPTTKTEAPSLATLEKMHHDAREQLRKYIASASEESLRQKQTLGPATASNRKILAQAILHSVHHWAQVAMEVRQAGLPTLPPQDIIISPVLE